MKRKNLLIIISLILIMGLIGCSTENKNNAKIEKVEESDISTQKEEKTDIKVETQSNKESIDLSDIAMSNVLETWDNTLNVPIYKSSEIDDSYSIISYIASNVDQKGNYVEFYQLSVAIEKSNVDKENAQKKLQSYSTDYDSNYNVQIIGNENSRYNIMYACSPIITDGTIKSIQDEYYIYDSSASCIYNLKLRIMKDVESCGDDVIENSTTFYREKLFETIISLVE